MYEIPRLALDLRQLSQVVADAVLKATAGAMRGRHGAGGWVEDDAAPLSSTSCLLVAACSSRIKPPYFACFS